MFAAAMMAAGVSATWICFSVKFVGPRSTVPQTNWIRNVRGSSEAIGVDESSSGRGGEIRALERDAPARPAGDDQGDPSPVSRRAVAIGRAFPTPRFSIGLIAKRTHERARGGVYSFGPFQLPKQPRKHIRPLGLDAGAWLGMRVLAAARRLPNGVRDIRPIALT